MKLLVNHDDLRRSLSFVQSAVAKRPTIAILAHVRLTIEDARLALATTDLNTTALTSIEAEVLATSDGTTVNMDALSDVAKAASAPMTLTTANDRLVITTGTSEFKLPTLPVGHYPTLPEVDNVDRVEFSASDLLGMLRTCDYAMADEVRENLNGVLFSITKKHAEFVATDGNRMAMMSLPFKGKHAETAVLLPEGIVKASRKLSVSADSTTAAVTWNDRHSGISLGEDTILHRQVDVNYPNYHSEVDGWQKLTDIRLLVDTQALLSAVRSVAPFGAGTVRTVAVSLSRGSIGLAANNIERGSSIASVAVDYPGPDLIILYGAGYLVGALENIHTQQVEIGLSSSKGAFSACRMAPVDSDLDYDAVHLVMPLNPKP